MKTWPCEEHGVGYAAAHCKPPVGDNQQGHQCKDCPILRLVNPRRLFYRMGDE